MDKKEIADVLETILDGLKSGDEVKQKLESLEKENEVLREAFKLISAPILYNEVCGAHAIGITSSVVGRLVQRSLEFRQRCEDPLGGLSNLVSNEELSDMQACLISQVRSMIHRMKEEQ